MWLAALVQSPDHVCCRYRLAAFRPALERASHTLQLLSAPRRTWGWFALRRELARADIVIVQRRLLSRWQLWLLRRASRFLCFDFDDAVFLRDSYAPKGIEAPRRARRFAAVVRAADAVVAGNRFLGERASAWTTPERLAVIPTCVEPADYQPAEHRRSGDGVELVWIGSSSTLRGLEAIQPLLEHVGRHVRGLRLKLVCDRFLTLEHLPVVPCPWSEAGEADALSAADIGISWVPDDDWSRGKCGLKVVQYLAAGLPVVANPVGVQAELVRHGETGFLVETPGEWVEAVSRLSRDPALRRRMGQAGRRLVEQHYSVARGSEAWIGLLDRLEHRRRLTG